MPMANLIFLLCLNELEVTIYQHSFKVKIKIKYPFLVRIILLHLFSN